MIRYRVFSFVTVVLLPLLSWGQPSAIQSVTIGKQVWMTRNLDVSTFRNGDPIPEAKSDAEWQKAGEEGRPAWCYYNNDPANGAKYGKLYNWYTVSDPRGLAPKGWHIPSDKEWIILFDFLGGKDVAGDKMKSIRGWNEEGNGSNTTRLSFFPGGYRSGDGKFVADGFGGYWWSSTKNSEDAAFFCILNWLDNSVGWSTMFKDQGQSVRCLRD